MATLIAPERRRTVRAPMSYEEYLILPDDGRRVEWVNGEGIHHQSPIVAHQEIVIFLAILLSGYVRRLNLGLVLGGLFEVRLWPNGPAREPDVLFIGRERLAQLTERRFEGGPDLVVEVVSPGSVTIDRVDKFLEYEQANGANTGSSTRAPTSNRPTSTSATPAADSPGCGRKSCPTPSASPPGCWPTRPTCPTSCAPSIARWREFWANLDFSPLFKYNSLRFPTVIDNK